MLALIVSGYLFDCLLGSPHSHGILVTDTLALSVHTLRVFLLADLREGHHTHTRHGHTMLTTAFHTTTTTSNSNSAPAI